MLARSFYLIALLLLVASCSTIEVQSPHLNISQDGYVTDDRGKVIGDVPRTSADNEETDAVAALMTRLDDSVAQDCSRPDKRSSHLMLVVHGGLVSTRAALEASQSLDDKRVFKDRDVRPIYINWNSSLFSSLADDLFWIKGGQRQPLGAVAFPAVVAWRLAQGVFNTLPNWYFQLNDEIRWAQKWPGETKPTFAEMAVDGGIGLLHSPLSIASVPLFSGFGRGAWEMMSRRIDMMYAVQKAPRRFGNIGVDAQPGVMRTFLDALEEHSGAWKSRTDCAVTLDFVGHSMGTLVGSRLLREYPGIEFDRIVFMAGASTVEDFTTTLPQYLSNNPESQFFSLGLSNIDEGNEITLLSWAFPRGSLLVWVDNFFDPILSPEDYRFGDFWNSRIFRVPSSIDAARCDRMRMIKVAGSRRDRSGWPRRHGDFNEPSYLGRLLDLTAPGASGMPTTEELAERCGVSCAVFSACSERLLYDPTRTE